MCIFQKKSLTVLLQINLHSRITVVEDTATLDQFSSEDSIALAGFLLIVALNQVRFSIHGKDDWGVPVVPSNSTNIVETLDYKLMLHIGSRSSQLMERKKM